jgi:hypothetical protein
LAAQCIDSTPRWGNRAHAHPISGVGTNLAVANEQVAVLQMGNDALADAFERRRLERLIDAAPVDLPFAVRFANDEAVFGRSAGACEGAGDQGAGIGEFAFAAAQGGLDQGRRGEVGGHEPAWRQAGGAQIKRRRRPGEGGGHSGNNPFPRTDWTWAATSE